MGRLARWNAARSSATGGTGRTRSRGRRSSRPTWRGRQPNAAHQDGVVDQRGHSPHDDPGIVDAVAAEALFDSLRAAMRGTDAAGQVPAIVGGYLIADAGEAAEGDRRRPIGQLRRLLSDAALSADMTDGQRWVLTSFYGLDAYPADIDAGGQSASLVGRVPLDVLQHKGDRRARRGSIEGYRRRGVAAVA